MALTLPNESVVVARSPARPILPIVIEIPPHGLDVSLAVAALILREVRQWIDRASRHWPI
jgi:hypothetical protein